MDKNISWKERLLDAKELGFDFVEISIDETDERLARLDWNKEKREYLVKSIFETGIKIPTMCFSGHRRFPMGSKNADTRKKAMELMEKAGVIVTPGASFGPHGEGYVRFALVLPPEKIKEAVESIRTSGI